MTVMEIAQHKVENWLEIIGLGFGMIMQLIVAKKTNRSRLKFLIFLILSSLFSAMFIVAPALEYFEIKSIKLSGACYALSSIISIQIVSFITTVLPKALQEKVLKSLGVNYDY